MTIYYHFPSSFESVFFVYFKISRFHRALNPVVSGLHLMHLVSWDLRWLPTSYPQRSGLNLVNGKPAGLDHSAEIQLTTNTRTNVFVSSGTVSVQLKISEECQSTVTSGLEFRLPVVQQLFTDGLGLLVNLLVNGMHLRILLHVLRIWFVSLAKMDEGFRTVLQGVEPAQTGGRNHRCPHAGSLFVG